MNLIARNYIYEKVHIFTNNSNDDKYFIIQIYKEYPSICQYKHLTAAVGLTDRYLRPIPC